MNIDDLKRRLEKAENKIELIKDKNIVSKYCIQTWQIMQLIIDFLGDEDKKNLLEDKDFIESSLGLKSYEIANLIEKLNSQEVKEVMIEKYNLKDIQIVGIIRTFSDEKKMTRNYQMLH